jgi:hypothetical protein
MGPASGRSGVSSALLIRNNIKLFSQRDYRAHLTASFADLTPLILRTQPPDHHQTEWYLEKFGSKG